ncbi:serine/threonine-protein kinase [Streptomyces sp. NPDC101160]|uniref:serine/threonine-protein kinase n=1 Tax=Streptomyces sp. NPDC101160 TaxID=3366118 RepID=UPI00382813D7
MRPLTGDDPRRLGAYRLLGRLGEGGMGVVYLGRSRGGRTVALKMVHGAFAADPGFRARFAREVRAAQALAGAGTVPVLDADPDAGTPWLATAYVPGPALSESVTVHGPLPEAALWRLLGGLAQALESVHSAGLVHRDVKPSNVLLSQAGPLLIDFGIARSADETALTGTGLVIGSPGYMSPEQAEGHLVGPPSDVFSLGAVLGFAATGRGPFGAGSLAQLLYRVVHHEPDLDGVEPGFAEVVRDCLAKSAADRPAPAELRAVAGARSSAAGAGWLPGPVIATIAAKAEALLNLEAEEPEPAEEPTARVPAPTPTSVLTESGTARRPAAPAPPPSRARAAGQDVRRPSAGSQISREVTDGLGNPLFSLLYLIPLVLYLVSRSSLVERSLRHPSQEAGNRGAAYEWAMNADWLVPVGVLVVVAMPVLYSWRARLLLSGGTRRAFRALTVSTGVHWIAAGAVLTLHTLSFVYLDSGTGEAGETWLMFVTVPVLLGGAPTAPFVLAFSLLRIWRGLADRLPPPLLSSS